MTFLDLNGGVKRILIAIVSPSSQPTTLVTSRPTIVIAIELGSKDDGVGIRIDSLSLRRIKVGRYRVLLELTAVVAGYVMTIYISDIPSPRKCCLKRKCFFMIKLRRWSRDPDEANWSERREKKRAFLNMPAAGSRGMTGFQS
ncbi:uncharacterized protein MELLADRAFT_113283 [Melampsora larici-populina 98AG31]|uniref:Uncharacterized protein n=1 Tax=Melampsora larici-populina (strain 98AG31 / pathotype 3-4-7) TaxID=747676 RepID=F4S9C5_MELLP|nr:uncharacterized protein MELLADRAFT_113283 [Melampsora larici-populina 98AG31]EGF98700.1 hypothetical protein MELLADRAFT_113283 [Melampsora larici-populina 98AG31]